MRETKEFEFLADAPIASEAEDVLNLYLCGLENKAIPIYNRYNKSQKQEGGILIWKSANF